MYAVEAERPVSEYAGVVAVPICMPPLKILYPVTAILSVEAFHVRLICDWEMAVPARFVGTEG